MPIATPLMAHVRNWAAYLALALALAVPFATYAQDYPEVDTALVVSVDVSNSVERRWKMMVSSRRYWPGAAAAS